MVESGLLAFLGIVTGTAITVSVFLMSPPRNNFGAVKAISWIIGSLNVGVPFLFVLLVPAKTPWDWVICLCFAIIPICALRLMIASAETAAKSKADKECLDMMFHVPTMGEMGERSITIQCTFSNKGTVPINLAGIELYRISAPRSEGGEVLKANPDPYGMKWNSGPGRKAGPSISDNRRHDILVPSSIHINGVASAWATVSISPSQQTAFEVGFDLEERDKGKYNFEHYWLLITLNTSYGQIASIWKMCFMAWDESPPDVPGFFASTEHAAHNYNGRWVPVLPPDPAYDNLFLAKTR